MQGTALVSALADAYMYMYTVKCSRSYTCQCIFQDSLKGGKSLVPKFKGGANPIVKVGQANFWGGGGGSPPGPPPEKKPS